MVTEITNEQTSIFSTDGICVVCGENVEPTICDGKVVTLMWCRSLCTSIYMAKWMTPKLSRFIEDYIIHLNATLAAKNAGYSERTAKQIGAENLTKPVVKQAISLAIYERSLRSKITADQVLNDIEMIKRDAMQKIVTVTPQADGTYSKLQVMANHAGALKACELHGKHLKMWTDKIEVGGDITVQISSLDEHI